MPYESGTQRLLLTVPARRFRVRVEVIREEKPLHELVGRYRPFGRDEVGHVEGAVVLDATAEAPNHARLMHECVEARLRH
jgi:hypothetical protein